jgi:Ca2+-binding EF-hand superfamily protein
MGNKAGKKVPKKATLKSKEIKNLSKQTGLTGEEITSVFEQFSENNPDGALNKVEFVRLYEKLRPESNEQLDEISEFVFNAFDEDQSGFIQFSEFLVAFTLTTKGDAAEKLGYAFELYDQDNNEYLDGDEVHDVLVGMLDLLGAQKQEYNIEELTKECISQLDLTNDNRIEKDEFVNGLMGNYSLKALMSPFN